MQTTDRQIIERATMRITVEELVPAARRVEALVQAADGRVERSVASGDLSVEYELRLPAGALRRVLAELRTLGEVDEETVTTTDVMGEMSDLNARLENLMAVRDRLRGYIDRAASVDEVISVERELTRVQTEIDMLTARLERLGNQVAMSQVSLTVNRRRTLGPLGWVGYHLGRLLEKLIFLD